MEDKEDSLFPSSGYFGPATFCDRKNEVATLRNGIKSGTNFTIYSPRRLGKTGLVQHYFHLERKRMIGLYINIYETNSLSELISLIAESIIQYQNQQKSFSAKVWEFIQKVQAAVGVDPLTGLPQVNFNFAGNLTKQQQTLAALFQYLDQQKKPVVVALDEFQQINQYPEKGTEAMLRTLGEQLKNVNFIYSGSQKHLIIDMFNNAKRPFYASTQFMKLEKIDRLIYGRFIKKQFAKGGQQIENEAVSYILDFTRVHTFYVQSLCRQLNYRGYDNITVEEVKREVINIFNEQKSVFFSYRNLLSTKQWKLLIAIAKEDKVYGVQSSKFLQEHQLGGASTNRRAVKSLFEKELLLEEIGEENKNYYQVQNVFLARWLAYTF